MDMVRTIPCITMQTAADDLGISRARLFKLLRDHKLFLNRLPRDALIKAGYFRVEIHEWQNPDKPSIRRQYGIAMVTGRGKAWLQEFVEDQEKAVEALGLTPTTSPLAAAS